MSYDNNSVMNSAKHKSNSALKPQACKRRMKVATRYLAKQLLLAFLVTILSSEPPPCICGQSGNDKAANCCRSLESSHFALKIPISTRPQSRGGSGYGGVKHSHRDYYNSNVELKLFDSSVSINAIHDG